MNIKKIAIKDLVKEKNTYPSWTTGSVYNLQSRDVENRTIVYYKIKNGREISRTFPKEILLTPKLSYILGFLRGEGPTSLGKSNYRRFTITNSDAGVMKAVLDTLHEVEIFDKSTILNKSIHLLHHTEVDEKVIDYWSSKLGLPSSRFKCFEDKSKTSCFGVCHVYISDVLLRRVIDLIHDEFVKKE